MTTTAIFRRSCPGCSAAARPANRALRVFWRGWVLAAAGRGFSFQRDEPLDMRMDRSRGRTAGAIIGTEDERELARLFYEYGEEVHSRRIARAIVERRRRESIRTTGELAALVEQ